MQWLLIIISLFLNACNSAEAIAPSIDQRMLPLDGTNNARDLGGYTTTEGRVVKHGLLFRSDSLAHLTDNDLVYLQQLDIAAITDLRSDLERAKNPDRLPDQSPPIKYATIEINNPALDIVLLGNKIFSGQISTPELKALLDRTTYVTNPTLRAEWGQWLKSLAEPNNLPHLFHCTAGKDRTGYAAALILITIGVSKEQVMKDFLLSNTYLQEKTEQSMKYILANASSPIDEDTLRAVIGVSSVSLESAYEAMEAEYGSVDIFIEKGLGIDTNTRQKIKSLVLK
jgi:protein-tyrosine phosphatase